MNVHDALPVLLLPLLGACGAGGSLESRDQGTTGAHAAPRAASATQEPSGPTALATFAGGCFWCMEKPFEQVPGVVSVVSGYTGGQDPDPTYEEVCSGTTGHAEAVQITYDPAAVGYRDLLEVFWRQIDPTDAGGQFVDRGNQYRAEIYVRTEAERAAAEASRKALAESGRFQKEIVTGITDFERFFPAEDYHQDYYLTNPERYHSYRSGSGRDRFLDAAWGEDRVWQPAAPWLSFVKPSEEELRERLDELQYHVTQEEGTERAFTGAYWDNHEPGLYVDVVSGEPLFSSTDKFESGTGWPSFTRPLADDVLLRDSDRKLGYERTEVRSAIADSHLGHVFPDGPKPTGLRYCINSAALRFVPATELEARGYGRYTSLFGDARAEH